MNRSPEELRRERAFQAAAALWERNIGPLDDTPAVRRAILDLITGTQDLSDADGRNFWDELAREAGDASTLGNWLDRTAAGGNWRMPNLDLGLGDSRLGRWWTGRTPEFGGRLPSTSGSRWAPRERSGGYGGPSGFGAFGVGGLGGTWLPVVLLAAVLLGGLVWWRFWYLRDPMQGAGNATAAGLGPWPVDPRRIATREDLIRAFEYLSVLTCGKAARTWTHGTIARALADLAATHAETALLLARLYELARYAPVDEPLTPAELAEGRRLVCQLAGVTAA